MNELSLTFEVLDNLPDWPVVRIRVDGHDPFADVAPDWRGFDPEDILGPESPLLPQEPAGRRIAVHRCSCGEAGCGVIAPVIVASPDRSHVAWIDFRNYTGVFNGPVHDDVDKHEGWAWDLPDLRFERDRYEAEIARASNDSTWETARRRTARLVQERLAPMDLTLPPGFTLRWVSPAWSDEGVTVMFARVEDGERPSNRQQALALRSERAEPEAAADDMVDQLLSTSPDDWVRTFGWRNDRQPW